MKPKTTYKVVRVTYTEDGTFGVLLDTEGLPLCVTLEDPDNNNQRNISCIPTGIYKVRKHNGAKYKDVWILEDVPNRAAILIHAGNTEDNTEGCILVGQFYGKLGNKPAILHSKVALKMLRNTLPDNFTLEITNQPWR